MIANGVLYAVLIIIAQRLPPQVPPQPVPPQQVPLQQVPLQHHPNGEVQQVLRLQPQPPLFTVAPTNAIDMPFSSMIWNRKSII